MKLKYTAVLFVAFSPLAAHAGTVRGEVAQDLADARAEVRADLAEERAKLENENLSLGDSLHFGKHDKHEVERRRTPKAEITPQGDLLVDGKAVAIDAAQRKQLLDYRAQVITLARTGIDAGERRVKATVVREIQPAVLQICRGLPQLRDSQQALAASLPEFRPYATLEQDDIDDCERDVRNDLAMR